MTIQKFTGTKIRFSYSRKLDKHLYFGCLEVGEKGVAKNIAKFSGKHLCQILFFNKVAC